MTKTFSYFIDYYKRTDKILIALCITCSIFSTVVLVSICEYFFSSYRYAIVQAVAALIGIVSAIILSKIDYQLMVSLNKYHAILAWGLVILTFFIGQQRGGADDRAWIALPMGLTFQPTELAKLSFIVTFATHLSKVKHHINDIKTVFLLTLHGALPVLLIHFQGDDGTAIVFLLIFLAMIFSAGLSINYIAIAGGLGAVIAPILWFFVFSEHQRLRFLTIFMPELDTQGIGYQAMQGKISIGAGGIFGTGLFSGNHRKIPEMHNDFIFAYIGEALGLIGCLLVIILLVGICMRILHTSTISTDSVGSFICVGVFMIFFAQIVMNIGMCLSVMPVIGVTLPFFSAGGTSVVTMYLSIGLVLSVYVHNKELIFDF